MTAPILRDGRGVSWAEAALLRLLRMKRRLLGLHLLYQFLNPIKISGSVILGAMRW
jgi:hypothetical protein